VNLGCRLNRVELDSIGADLLSAGLAFDDENPDLVVINTCCVTGAAEKKTRKAVRHELNAHASIPVFVVGCAINIHAQDYLGLSDRVQLASKDDILSSVNDVLGLSLVKASQSLPRAGEHFVRRAGIKIQDGCDCACTFCIVHVARGKSRSVPSETVLGQARELVDAGIRELVITGVNLGCYHEADKDLVALLRELRASCPKARIRISSIEPKHVSNELIDLMASEDGMICRHLHIPIQSGSNKVLREMARPYTREFLLELASNVRDRIPEVVLTTDIIVGFPGESDEDFDQSCSLMREMQISKIHVFRYSARKGTPAAERDDQVPAGVLAERAQKLAELGAQLRDEIGLARLGSTEAVLVEAQGRGTTESFYEVELTGDEELGSLMRANLTSYESGGIFSL